MENSNKSQKPGFQQPPGSPPPPANPPPPRSLPPSSFRDLTGSTWLGKDSENKSLRFTFLPGGVLEYETPTGIFRNGTWQQTGAIVRMEMNNHYADYEGDIQGDVILGHSHNITGKEWTWNVTLTVAPAAVIPAPVVPAPAGYTADVLGSTWEGTGAHGESLRLTFLPNGVLRYVTPSGTWENGTWKQHDAAISIETNNHYADYTGTIEGDLLNGTAHNATGFQWTWSVRRTSPGAPAGKVIALSGTVWDGTDSDGTYEIYRFLPNGKINYTSPSGTFENGTWTQSGASMTMEFNNHYADYRGTIAGERISGTATNKTGKNWTWSLSVKK